MGVGERNPPPDRKLKIPPNAAWQVGREIAWLLKYVNYQKVTYSKSNSLINVSELLEYVSNHQLNFIHKSCKINYLKGLLATNYLFYIYYKSSFITKTVL